MVLFHTAGLWTPGPTCVRRLAKFNKGKQYLLEQPYIHSMYWVDFSAIDIFKKVALEPNK